jgi:hypothetical protein
MIYITAINITSYFTFINITHYQDIQFFLNILKVLELIIDRKFDYQIYFVITS